MTVTNDMIESACAARYSRWPRIPHVSKVELRNKMRIILTAAFSAAPQSAVDARFERRLSEYTPDGRYWFHVTTIDEMQAFYLSRLPAIREAARELGYAIGLHGSTRRDLDLIAMPWREDAADRDALAHAIAKAACGLGRDGPYDWTVKPVGRFATSIPICWKDFEPRVDGQGMIDLSVMPALAAAQAVGVPHGWTLVPVEPTHEMLAALWEAMILSTYDGSQAPMAGAGYDAALAAAPTPPAQEPFPKPQRKDGGEPCGECHVQPGETCDICGAVGPVPEPTYISRQATECAVCGVRKHTPLRRDEMGGYVCLTCIDKRLDAWPQPAQAEPVGWQLIETAPTDGSTFLAIATDVDRPTVTICKFDNEKFLAPSPDEKFALPGWGQWWPSHWMPIPNGPTTNVDADLKAENGSKPMDLGISKEWLEKRAAAEGDLEISAGRRTMTVNLTPDEIAELEKLLPRSAEVAALKAENERLKEVIAGLEDDLDDARQEPWPEWAKAVVKVIREHTGYDGYDDATEGVDMPAELAECLSELSSEANRQKARAAAAEAREKTLREAAVPEELRKLTFAIQHNPNCSRPWLIRRPGRRGLIDLKPYGNGLPRVKHETEDLLFFGKTLADAARDALKGGA